MPLLCWFKHFLVCRAEICQIFRWFFGKFKNIKGHSEIIWPLAAAICPINYKYPYHQKVCEIPELQDPSSGVIFKYKINFLNFNQFELCSKWRRTEMAIALCSQQIWSARLFSTITQSSNIIQKRSENTALCFCTLFWTILVQSAMWTAALVH